MKWYQILWELPQMLAGLILAKFVWKNKKVKNVAAKEIKYLHGLEKITAKRIYIVEDDYMPELSSFSLGIYVFIKLRSLHDLLTIRHECIGHSKQSKKYGLFYLLSVAPVSVIRNIYGRYHKIDYYGAWPENEADKLGGVVWVGGERVISGILIKDV